MATEATSSNAAILATMNSAMETVGEPISIDVRRAQRGDTQAFERLYRQHVGRVYALCLRMVADPSRAEDLTQEAFVRAWSKIDSFAGRSAFSTWLHRLTVNVVLSAQRKADRSREQQETEPGTLYRHPAAKTRHGLAVDLEKAIAALPSRARKVFVLSQIEGYSHEEVAGFLGISAGTSKAHLFTARQKLKESLQ